VAAQTVGAAIGAALVWLAYLPHWEVTTDAAGKLGCFATAPAIAQSWPNFLAEMVGTSVLVFGVLSLGQISELLAASGFAALSAFFGKAVAPLFVGLLVFSIGLSLGGPTGYAINPARDLGPRVAHALLPIAGKGDSNWPYAWIPVAGPLAGGVLGALLYRGSGLSG
jgi:glycerol uptake facilitator protein